VAFAKCVGPSAMNVLAPAKHVLAPDNHTPAVAIHVLPQGAYVLPHEMHKRCLKKFEPLKII
jgi:hypothetical protein